MVRSLEGKHPMYYEAILQLREVSLEVETYARKEITQAQIPLTKEVATKHGVDLYLADSNFTKGLGRKLQQRYGGKVIMTSSLHTRIKGKEVYRVTVLFRGVPFAKQDLVEYAGEEYKVIGMQKDIFLQSVKTGKKIHIEYTQAHKLTKVEK